MNIGFIGTGTMGNPMARSLIEGGHTVTVFDVRREAAANLCEMGANWADSPRLAAEASSVVHLGPGPGRGRTGAHPPRQRHPGGSQRRRRLDRHHDQLAVGHPPPGRDVRGGRSGNAGLAGQRPAAQHDDDGRRRPGRLREIPARAGLHGPLRLLRRPHSLRLHRQAGYPIPGLLRVHCRDRRDADRGQGRHRPGYPGPDNPGKRRLQQCARPRHRILAGPQLRIQWGARHRGEGRASGLRVGP